MSKSNVLKYLSGAIPGIFSKKTVEELIMKNEISYEAANAIVADAESAIRSSEATGATGADHVDLITLDKAAIAQEALKRHFTNVKFEALLNKIKEDDTLMYDEFVNVDNARNEIMAKIISKYEHDFDILLNQVKTTSGVNADALDALISTKLGVAAVD